MALETGTYIGDLNPANPTAADPKSDGDDHLRLIKSVAKNSFPNVAGPVTASHVELSLMAGATTQPAMKDGSNLTTPTVGDNSTKIATTAFVTAAAFKTALPAQALGLLASDGTNPSFTKSIGFGLNEAKASPVASAASPDIWSGNGNTLHITGTTTITGFPAAPQAGARRRLYFDGAVLLTNGPNLRVQGGDSYTTSPGDMVEVFADTATVFDLTIARADGRALAATPVGYMHVREQQASGTNGGTSTSGVTHVRTLNTVVGTNSITGASLASNAVTLPAGTYEFFASAPCYAGDMHKLTLYNQTDAADIMVGSSVSVTGGSTTTALCSGKFTLAAQKAVQLRHYINTGSSPIGLGKATANDQVEVYATLELRKVG